MVEIDAPKGSAVILSIVVTVINGIFHPVKYGKEYRYGGLNACTYSRWRGRAFTATVIPYEIVWVGITGCPVNNQRLNNSILGWLKGRLYYSLAGKVSLDVWYDGKVYRGNKYDVRVEWAITPG